VTAFFWAGAAGARETYVRSHFLGAFRCRLYFHSRVDLLGPLFSKIFPRSPPGLRAVSWRAQKRRLWIFFFCSTHASLFASQDFRPTFFSSLSHMGDPCEILVLTACVFSLLPRVFSHRAYLLVHFQSVFPRDRPVRPRHLTVVHSPPANCHINMIPLIHLRVFYRSKLFYIPFPFSPVSRHSYTNPYSRPHQATISSVSQFFFLLFFGSSFPAGTFLGAFEERAQARTRSPTPCFPLLGFFCCNSLTPSASLIRSAPSPSFPIRVASSAHASFLFLSEKLGF